MRYLRLKFFTGNKKIAYPNLWDLIAFCIIFAVFALLAWGAHQISVPYQLGQPLHLSLDPHYLPFYAVRTLLRMLIALGLSLLFTFTVATWAAKSRYAEQIIIPFIDVMQSIPVLPMISLTVVGFIHLFPNSLLGPECASIFAIFTAQAWNMALSFYQSLSTVPNELKEASRMFRLSAWQRFWRLDVPFAVPGLLWNMMMSMSGSWFFLTVSESITISNQTIRLPGIGSYIALAIAQMDIHAVFYAIITMLVVILAYDQLLFRPLVYWANKFRVEMIGEEIENPPFFTHILERTHLVSYLAGGWGLLADNIINFKKFKLKLPGDHKTLWSPKVLKVIDRIWHVSIMVMVVSSIFILMKFILTYVSLHEVLHVIVLGFFTGLRVLAAIAVSSLIWVPIGVMIGLRHELAEKVQPLVQFIAAFPANLLFPLIVPLIVNYHLNVQIWITPLMIIGTQWYILFNVIAGASSIPKDLKQAMDNAGVKGWLWWRRFILPAIFPYYITGAITAAGGAWNTSVVAEVASWGSTTLQATGIGAYITEYSYAGNFPYIVLGMSVMCLYVLTLNRLVWRKLYLIAVKRFSLD